MYIQTKFTNASLFDLLHFYLIFDQYFPLCYIHPHGLGLYIRNSQTENLPIKSNGIFVIGNESRKTKIRLTISSTSSISFTDDRLQSFVVGI